MCSVSALSGSLTAEAADEKSRVVDALVAELRDQGNGLSGVFMKHRFMDLVGSSLSPTTTITFRPTRLCRKMSCNGSSRDCARRLAESRCGVLRAVSMANVAAGRTIMRLYLDSPLVDVRTGKSEPQESVSD